MPTYREVDAILTASGAGTFTVPGLSPRKIYAFTVSAGNEYGWSGPSVYAVLTTGSSPSGRCAVAPALSGGHRPYVRRRPSFGTPSRLERFERPGIDVHQILKAGR